MNQLLKPGQKLHGSTTGQTVVVERFLGAGGQGEVYQVVMDGQSWALKWYFANAATPDQHEVLQQLVRPGSAPHHTFLWPQEIVSAGKNFGYLMPLRQPRFRDLKELLKKQIDPDFRERVTACFHLAHSYLQLHSKGLYYADINSRNVFLDPTNGDVLICDNDNVTVNGKGHFGVWGTPGFAAPEVTRREARPSTYTDLHSLAVLLFLILMMNHPLDGKKETAIRCGDLLAKERLYGHEPCFIFDPNDQSNAADAPRHQNALLLWPVFPQFIRDRFLKSFTLGLSNPSERVAESVWRADMVRLRDAIALCGHCRSQFFVELDSENSSAKRANDCWNCGKHVLSPPRLRFAKGSVVLNQDTRLYAHHVDTASRYDFETAVAELSQHPERPEQWGLKNISNAAWSFALPDGSTGEVPPGRSVALVNGVRVHFGKTEAELTS